MEKRKVTLYVRSVKTVVGAEKWGKWDYVGGPSVRGGYRLIRDYKVYSEPKYEFALPEGHEKVVEMTKQITPKYGFEVEVVDAAKEKGVKIKVFPTLMIDSGEKIEGKISEKQIESFLAKLASIQKGKFHERKII
ncbi:MAG: hypothetical protein ACPLVJ_03015 [Candidatus Bathyarchaeales archaeon]